MMSKLDENHLAKRGSKVDQNLSGERGVSQQHHALSTKSETYRAAVLLNNSVQETKRTPQEIKHHVIRWTCHSNPCRNFACLAILENLLIHLVGTSQPYKYRASMRC